MNDWHFATAFELVADVVGDRTAMVCGDNSRSWSEFDDRAARLAQALTEHGLGPASNIGTCLHNSNEYLEAHHAILKLRGSPINVNYRYKEEELAYLINNAEMEAVFFHDSYTERFMAIRDRCPTVKCFVQVKMEGNITLPDGVLDYENLIETADPMPRINRPGDDMYLLYTGGTTGLPKGVQYGVEDICKLVVPFPYPFSALPTEMADLPKFIQTEREADRLPNSLVCSPLMHGTGLWVGALMCHMHGGKVVTIDRLGLDPARLWSEASAHQAHYLTIVGDAFARPLLEELNAAAARGEPYALEHMRYMLSSGVMFSQEVKAGILEHLDIGLVDFVGASEGTYGASVTTRTEKPATGFFQIGPNTKVLKDNGEEVLPGSGETGKIACRAAMLGYYKDEDKTAEVTRIINGERWVTPGDFGTVEADGTLRLLGRGSVCINTGGEKVYPEEVEEAIKSHAQVRDCLVVGVPDERFGERVIGVVSRHDQTLDEEPLIAFTKTKVAGYKTPKQMIWVDKVGRMPNGKADYKWAKATALDALGLS